MTLTQSEIEELRVAIAEGMGWTFQQGTEPTYGGTNKNTGWFYSNGKWKSGKDSHPPYTTSIDAIREAAMERFKTDADHAGFLVSMFDQQLEQNKCLWQLTALDWCIAFCKTAKIWRYK